MALNIVIKGADQAQAAFTSVKGGLLGIGEAAANTGKAASGFFSNMLSTAAGFLTANVIGKITEGFQTLAGGMVSGNAEFERYETQFGVLLGSVGAAKSRLKDLADFGAKTPFELPEVVRADKIMQGFGLHAEDAAKRFGMSGAQIRTVAGDVAAGTGAGFEQIAGYLGKFASGATGEAIARFQELGIVTRDQLAKMGLEFSKSGQLLSPLDQSMSVLLASMKAKYGGMMDKQSATFEGMLSNMQDWMGAASRTLGAPLFDVLKVQLKSLLDMLNQPIVQQWLERIGALIGQVAATISDHIERIITVFANLGRAVAANGFGELFAVFEDGSSFLSSFLEALGMGEPLAQRIGAVFGWLGSTITTVLGTAFTWITQTALPALTDAWAAMQPYLQVGATLFTQLAASINTGIGIALRWLGETGIPLVMQGWAMLQPAITGVWNAIQPLITAFGDGGIKGAFAALLPVGLNVFAMVNDLRLKVIDMLGQALPGIIATLQQWGFALLNWIVANAPAMLAAIGKMYGDLMDALGRALPGIIQALATWGAALVQWVTDNAPTLLRALGALAEQVLGWAKERVPLFATQLAAWAEEFIKWVIPAASGLIYTLGVMFGELLGWIWDNREGIIRTIGGWANAFTDWVMRTAVPLLFTELGKLWDKMKEWLKQKAKDIQSDQSVGTAITDAIKNGIDKGLGAVKDKGKEIALQLWEGFKKQWQELWDKFKDSLRGIGQGMDRMLGDTSVPAYAGGGRNVPGGLAMVGERGPELVRLPGGSDVIPLTGSGGGSPIGNTNNFTFNLTSSAPLDRQMVYTTAQALAAAGIGTG